MCIGRYLYYIGTFMYNLRHVKTPIILYNHRSRGNSAKTFLNCNFIYTQVYLCNSKMHYIMNRVDSIYTYSFENSDYVIFSIL